MSGVCQQVNDDLKRYMQYKKNSEGLFKRMLPHLEVAIKNAALLSKYCENNDSKTHTYMGELMTYIKNFKDQRLNS